MLRECPPASRSERAAAGTDSTMRRSARLPIAIGPARCRRNAEGGYRWFLSRAEPLRASDGTLLQVRTNERRAALVAPGAQRRRIAIHGLDLGRRAPSIPDSKCPNFWNGRFRCALREMVAYFSTVRSRTASNAV
jgi:hypothetical protein